MATENEFSTDHEDCPLSRGNYPADFAERIKVVAQKSSEAMTPEEAKAWLNDPARVGVRW